MQKIPSLFKRDYEGSREVYDEVVEGCEWVLDGEGVATIKFDGTSCLYKDGQLWKRYDRKVSNSAKKRGAPYKASDYKPAPDGWIQAEEEPNQHTGHWPGWLPVGDGPEDQYHREALAFNQRVGAQGKAELIVLVEGATYELVGPKIQGNPYDLSNHRLWRHGTIRCGDAPRDFAGLLLWFAAGDPIEGIVWHHPDGRMCKIKRKDFGLKWPVEREIWND